MTKIEKAVAERLHTIYNIYFSLGKREITTKQAFDILLSEYYKNIKSLIF
jgi:hypothetical protein